MADADLRRIQQAGERYLQHMQSQGRRSGMGAASRAVDGTVNSGRGKFPAAIHSWIPRRIYGRRVA